MSLSNLALIVYLVVLSFIINEMMFSYLDKSKTLKLFRWRNTFKSEKFIDWWKLRNAKDESYRMKLNAALPTRIRSQFCYLFAQTQHERIQTYLSFRSAKAHSKRTHCVCTRRGSAGWCAKDTQVCHYTPFVYFVVTLIDLTNYHSRCDSKLKIRELQMCGCHYLENCSWQ